MLKREGIVGRVPLETPEEVFGESAVINGLSLYLIGLIYRD